MTLSAVLGYPRVGPKREVKKATEAYWAGKLSADELQKVAKEQRLLRWQTLQQQGVDVIPSGDFTLYDHVLDFNNTFNIIPKRFADAQLSDLDRYFAMGRGHQKDGVDLEAQEMQKWFDSNYHYIKSEVSSSTQFKLNNLKPVDEFVEAKEAGIVTRPVLVGPITALLLGKVGRDEPNPASFDPLSLLDKLVPVYGELLQKLQQAGATEVQIDEPSLVMDSTANLGAQYQATFDALAKAAPGLKITLATYFGRLDKNVEFVAKLPIDTLHVDLDRAADQLDQVVEAVKPTSLKLSLGLVSGRNIWKNDLAASLATAKKVIDVLGQDRVVVATSSSLLHTPVTLANESRLKPEQKDWFSFATEKAAEVATLAKALSGADVSAALDANKQSIQARRDFEKNSDAAVRERLSKVTPDMYDRKSPFAQRIAAQDAVYKLPPFPTTTIGSFPQTKEIRLARSKHTKGELSTEEYEKFLENEIKHAVEFQEEIDIDLLVHGEAERNDMSQYFGEQLQGFVFTENAWVQSYGSRYVRPPIVVSDVSRPTPMTVRWSSYAQSLTKRPMKGMLTGPVTILNWSFPRADISKEVQCKQLALALRDEVVDLEKAGIFAIQVDEPAIREGLPLRQVDWNSYLTWAVDSFKLATAGVEDRTQTHSHFCYSDFNLIFEHIKRLDADVISIEASKSDLKLLDAFNKYSYNNLIGPGLYDIHSPRVPSVQEMKDRLAAFKKALPNQKHLFVNPDCGLKTRGWDETKRALTNLVEVAKWAREEFA
ncbi:5-methyltetrahydropteroyltriglutamate-homocysteine S-methyltransferase [Rhodotorula paludigena]|uniref:5-methyltetrahydropteroyltriglutamate- homocysteine S-methyltransferase n=1 Tax=Rhodotorula paludigena TaxID=86838 RepID=UPI00317C603C